MEKQVEKKEQLLIEGLHITYYFTVIFTLIGTLLILYVLSQKVDNLNLFIILLSITAGGLPVGVIGAFIDYKISEYRLKSNKIL